MSRARISPAPTASGPAAAVRVALYRRASTDEHNQPYSLDAQDTRLRAYVASHPEWTVVADHVERASGKDVAGRPELRALLAAAAHDQFDLVVVARIDRWSRSLIDLLHTVEQLDKAGVGFHSASENFDTASPMGRLMLQMLGMFAEFERSLIIDRIRRGNAAKVARGIPLTSKVSFGLRVNTDGVIVADPKTIGIVRRIFNEYATGRHGLKALAVQLNSERTPAPGARPWSAPALSRILCNRTYLGELWHVDRWLPGAHDPFIDLDLFARVQTLADQRRQPSSAAHVRGDYLLTGVLTCARCQGAYVGTAGTSAHGKRTRYYSCGRARRYGPTTCNGPSLPADDLELLVTDALLETYANTDLFDQAIDAALAEHAAQVEPMADQAAVARAELAKKQRLRARYQDDYESGELSAARYEQRASELDDDIGALTSRLAQLEHELAGPPLPTRPTPAELARMRADLEHGLRDGPTAARKDLIRALVASIAVHDRDDIRPTFRLYGAA